MKRAWLFWRILRCAWMFGTPFRKATWNLWWMACLPTESVEEVYQRERLAVDRAASGL